MAITVVTTAEGQKTDGTTISLVLGSLLQGDVVFVFEGEADIAGPRGMQTAGYTSLGWDTDATTISFGGYYKVMGVSPDTTAVVNAGANTVGHAAVAVVLRGVHVSVIDANSTPATDSSGSPNPPSVTVASTGAVVIVAATKDVSDTLVLAPTSPVTFTNLVDINSDTTTDATTAAAVGVPEAIGAFDPSSFSGWTGGVNWIAGTVSVKAHEDQLGSLALFGLGSLSVDTVVLRAAAVTFAGAGNVSARLNKGGTHDGDVRLAGAGTFQADSNLPVQRADVRFVGAGAVSVQPTLRMMLALNLFGFTNGLRFIGLGQGSFFASRTDIEEWPVNDEALVTSFAEEFESNMVSFTPDAGPELVYRNRSISTQRFSISTYLSFADYATLRTFYRVTLRSGTLSFTRRNPITGVDDEFLLLSEPQARAVDYDRLLVTYSIREVTP